jgi:hypothetical protein
MEMVLLEKFLMERTTVTKTTTVPSGKGFANSLKVAVTGADT